MYYIRGCYCYAVILIFRGKSNLMAKNVPMCRIYVTVLSWCYNILVNVITNKLYLGIQTVRSKKPRVCICTYIRIPRSPPGPRPPIISVIYGNLADLNPGFCSGNFTGNVIIFYSLVLKHCFCCRF